jgi:hypothetical protein
MNQFTVCNWLILNFFIIQLIICGSANAGGKVNNEELYKLLNVSKTVNTKEIRIAFKKIALEKHPDKNTVNICLLTKRGIVLAVLIRRNFREAICDNF